MPQFTDQDHWKALILYGLNQATYKIALGKTLLGLCDQGYTCVPWDVLSHEFLQQYLQRLASGEAMPQQSNPSRRTKMESSRSTCGAKASAARRRLAVVRNRVVKPLDTQFSIPKTWRRH